MKYGQTMKMYDPDACIAYNSIKRLMKGDAPPQNWRELLYKECSRVDGCTGTYRVVNTDAFYKLCKKLDKRYGVGALDFYRECVRQRTFSFTSVTYETLLC